MCKTRVVRAKLVFIYLFSILFIRLLVGSFLDLFLPPTSFIPGPEEAPEEGSLKPDGQSTLCLRCRTLDYIDYVSRTLVGLLQHKGGLEPSLPRK